MGKPIVLHKDLDELAMQYAPLFFETVVVAKAVTDRTGEFDILKETDHDKDDALVKQGKKKKRITNQKRIKKTFKRLNTKNSQRKIERTKTVEQLKAILSDREKDSRYPRDGETTGINHDFKYRCCGMLGKAIYFLEK